MIRFGPAGNCDRFYEEGNNSSIQAPVWIAEQGLNAYEYAAGHGLSLRPEIARKIGAAAREAGVSISIHAPYYISCGNADKAESSIRYLIESARAVAAMGGTRVVFHPGSPGNLSRAEAIRIMLSTISQARRRLDEEGLEDIFLCPETMGRPSQLGTMDEVLLICREVERTLPTVDFAHLHAAGGGALNREADFEAVIQRLMDGIGSAGFRRFHAHFSHISYTAKGEKCHMTFSDSGYGPDFSLLAPILVKYDLEPTIICESRGTQADDAMIMKRLYSEAVDQAEKHGQA